MTSVTLSLLIHLALIHSIFFFRGIESESFFNSSVGPVAICGKKHLNIETTLSECYERCRRNPQPSSTAKIGLHQVTAKGAGPRTVECTKVTITQQFTETWTFSTFKSEPTREYSLPSDEECRAAISKSCGNYECNERGPSSLPDEYSYASTNTKKESYLILLTMPSSFFTSGKTLMIMPLSSEEHFDVERESGSTLTARYYWKKISPLTECPFERVGISYGCDYYTTNDADKHWLCNRGGFSLTPKSNISDVIPACSSLVQSKEGMIYEVLDTTDKLNIWSQRLGLVGTTYKDADVDWLRAKVNHIMSNLDSDLCLLQCETLSLEARIHRSTSRILKISSNIILLRPDGAGEKCEMAHGCHLTKPHIMCGSPPRVAITCTGTSAYWDPKEPYALMAGDCPKPENFEQLTFTAGHHTYNIDDDLMSKLPSGFMHGRTHDLFSIDHLKGLQFKQKDIDEIRASWTSHKTNPKTTVKLSEQIERDHSGVLTDLISGSKRVLMGIIGAFGYLRYLIYFSVVICVAFFSIKLSIYLIKSKATPRVEQVYYAPVSQANKPVVQWI
ncbi:TPA_asm: G [Euphorbia alphacytorhabdovirus 1]|nr:TPA_asm: G [Euphorbia alphacytorhabdovirus 1]